MRITIGRAAALVVAIGLCTLDLSPSLAEEPGGIEEIVVTARKRDELLIDTPVSMTALSETALRDAGVSRLDEIQGLVPNLQFSVGRESQEGFIRLRGVGTTSGEIVFDPGVAVYVDGVFLPRMIGQLVDVVDVQQIEVLRGPQGTLFGKNSVGGAIKIETIKPQPELGGKLFVRAGNYDLVRTQAVLNVPLIEDKLLSRFAIANNYNSGYSRNELLDIDVSDQNSLTFFGSLRWLPLDDVTVDVSGTWSRNDAHGRGGQCRIVYEDGLAVTGYPGFADACQASEPFRFRGNVRTLADTSSWGTWGTIDWDANDFLAVKSITSWREQKPGHRSEADNTEFPALSLDFSGQGDNPTWAQRQISQELQTDWTFWDDKVSIVGGAFAMWERGYAPTGISALTDFLNVETQSTTRTDNWSWALFAHGVIDPVEWLSITLGLRYTQDKKGASLVILDRSAGDQMGPSFGSQVFDAWTPEAKISLITTDGVADTLRIDHGMVYFGYSQGFRGGGYNALINIQEGDNADGLTSFEPETLDNFEIGIKGEAFDRRLRATFAAFYSDYDDIQVITNRATGDLDNPETIMLQQLTQNAAKATVKGIELEFLALPTDEFQISGSIGLLDTNYDDFGKNCDFETGANCALSDAEPGVFVDRSGQGFNVSPDLMTNLVLQYSLPIDDAPRDFLLGSVTPRLQWSYQSRMHVLGPEVADAIQRGYNLLDARLGYRFWDDRAEIALWGKNLTDEVYFDRAETLALLGFIHRYFQTPRTYGGEVTLNF